MIATFPHMGNIYIMVKTLFDEMGIDYVLPPKCSKKTLEIGAKYSPEMACLPLKINIGNFIESIEKGADTIFITGACGPCRFGYYAEMHREILRDLGYDAEVVALEINEKGLKDLIAKLKKLTGGKKLASLAKPLFKAYKALCMADKIDELSYQTRPLEITKGQTDKVIDDYRNKLLETKSVKETFELMRDTEQRLLNIELERKDTVKVGIVGEIYTLIEPFTNLHIEKILGNMGITAHRSLYISQWIKEHIIKQGLHIKSKKEFAVAAKPYLKTHIGGHALETIGNSVLYARGGYDGVVQIYPLTCMPEIVADGIMPAVRKDYDLPSLTLVMDEITGEAGYLTRIDAFADMLIRRKRLREEKKKNEVLLLRH